MNDKQSGLCAYCLDNLLLCNLVHIDHIHPESKWWDLSEENTCLCCGYCNTVKRENNVDYILNRLKPYREGIVKDKKDLKDYHKRVDLNNKFTS